MSDSPQISSRSLYFICLNNSILPFSSYCLKSHCIFKRKFRIFVIDLEFLRHFKSQQWEWLYISKPQLSFLLFVPLSSYRFTQTHHAPLIYFFIRFALLFRKSLTLRIYTILLLWDWLIISEVIVIYFTLGISCLASFLETILSIINSNCYLLVNTGCKV